MSAFAQLIKARLQETIKWLIKIKMPEVEFGVRF